MSGHIGCWKVRTWTLIIGSVQIAACASGLLTWMITMAMSLHDYPTRFSTGVTVVFPNAMAGFAALVAPFPLVSSMVVGGLLIFGVTKKCPDLILTWMIHTVICTILLSFSTIILVHWLSWPAIFLVLIPLWIAFFCILTVNTHRREIFKAQARRVPLGAATA